MYREIAVTRVKSTNLARRSEFLTKQRKHFSTLSLVWGLHKQVRCL